jgi:integrase/recombinase XerD
MNEPTSSFNRSVAPGEGARTLSDLVEKLLDHYRSIQSSPQTLVRLRRCLRRFLIFLEDRYELRTADRLHVEHLAAYQQTLAEHRTVKGLPLKPITINTVIKSVRAFLDFLHERGYLSQPLAWNLAYVREPKLLPTSVLTHAQVRRLLRQIDTTTAQGIRDRAALELLYSSGIRIGEMEALKVAVTPHTFRRSCTTEMIKGNANLYHVKKLLGHEKLDTLHHYTRLDITDLQRTHARCHPREKDE